MPEEKESRHEEREQAKRYLMQIRDCEIIVEQRKVQRGRLRAEAYGLKGISYDKDRVQTSPDESAMERFAERLSKIEKEITDAILNREEMRAKIIREIQGMEKKKYAAVLYKRYVEIRGRRLKSFEAIAVELGYSCDHIKRMHGRALWEFWQQYRNEIT